MVAKLKPKTHLQNTFLDFFELFFARLALKFEKAQIWPKKKILKKSKKVSKSAEFHADFESVEKYVKKCTKKKL